MTTPTLKRRVVVAENPLEFEAKINALSDEGYTFEHFMINNNPQCYEQETFYAIAKLKSEADVEYKGMIDMMELPIDKIVGDMKPGSPLIEKAIVDGWVIITHYKGTKDTPSTVIMGRRKQCQ